MNSKGIRSRSALGNGPTQTQKYGNQSGYSPYGATKSM